MALDYNTNTPIASYVFLHIVKYVYADGQNWFWVPIILYKRNYIASMAVPMYSDNQYKIGLIVGMHVYINEVPDLGPGPYITHYGIVDFDPSNPGSGSEVGKIVASSNLRYEDWDESAEGVKWNYLTIASLSQNPGCPVLTLYNGSSSYVKTKVLEASESWFWAPFIPLDVIPLNIPYRDVVVVGDPPITIDGDEGYVYLSVTENDDNMVFIDGVKAYVTNVPGHLGLGVTVNGSIVAYKPVLELLEESSILSNNTLALNTSVDGEVIKGVCGNAGLVIRAVSVHGLGSSLLAALPKSPLLVNVYLDGKLIKRNLVWIHNVEDSYVIELNKSLCNIKNKAMTVVLYTPANIDIRDVSLVRIVHIRSLKPLYLKQALLEANNTLVNVSSLLEDNGSYVVLRKGYKLNVTYEYKMLGYYGKHKSNRKYLIIVIDGFYIPEDWYRILGSSETLSIMAYKIPRRNAYYLFPILRSYDNIISITWKVNDTDYSSDVLLLGNLDSGTYNVTLTVSRMVNGNVTKDSVNAFIIQP